MFCFPAPSWSSWLWLADGMVWSHPADQIDQYPMSQWGLCTSTSCWAPLLSALARQGGQQQLIFVGCLCWQVDVGYLWLIMVTSMMMSTPQAVLTDLICCPFLGGDLVPTIVKWCNVHPLPWVRVIRMAIFRQHAFDAFVHGRCCSAGAQVTNIGVGGHQVDYETPTMRVAWQRSQCELYHEYDGISGGRR